jgi:hypothetical protein
MASQRSKYGNTQKEKENRTMIKWVCPIDGCDYELRTSIHGTPPLEPYECLTHFCPLMQEKDMAEQKRAIAVQFHKFIHEGMDVMNSLKALYALGHDPDIVNKFMDDYANKYNASPLEYQDNLATTRNELLGNLDNLY